MVVCMSRRICVELYRELVRLRPSWAHDDDDRGAFRWSGVPLRPGTRITSPNVVRVTAGSSASASASSTRPIGSTQTGQPGP